MISYGFYPSIFWVICQTIWWILMIILSYNKLWRYFICSWLNINLKMMRWQECGLSVPIEKNLDLIHHLKLGWLTSLHILSKPLCFIVLVYHGWYKQRMNIILILMNIFLIDVQYGNGIIKLLFITYIGLYFNISFSMNS